MAGRRRLERKTDDRRPVVTDDFIYDDPQNPSNEEVYGTFSSDTPEEAIRKLKSISQSSVRENESGDNPADSLPGPGRKPVQDVVTAPEKKEETASDVVWKIRDRDPIQFSGLLVVQEECFARAD